jgi:peptidyl-prolyl cis-trans isomerase D
MMSVFRGLGTKLAAVVFAVLMLVFVLTSVDWGTFGTTTTVGKINGERVDARAYEQAVQEAINRRQQESPAQLGLEDYAAIRNEVWEQFVQSAVLEEEYRRRGITASDDEVVEAMRTSPLPEFLQVPEFQTDSQFDLAKYQRWLGSSVAQQYLPLLEAQYRDQVQRGKLLRVVTADVYLSDAALWERYRDRNETVKVALTAIVPDNEVPDSAVRLTDAEVSAYYQAHKDEFKRPRTAYLSYVALPRLPNASDTALARTRADSARREIAGGAPFADVARRESADSASAAKGGDLGEWTRGTMDPAFDSAAFALPLNRVSEPVLSRFGFHLIEVTKRRGNKASGRHILFPIEVDGAHRDSLDAQADSLEEIAAEQESGAALDAAARALRLPVGRTLPVQEGTKAQVGNLAVPDAGVWAFQSARGSTSPVIETSIAYYVFRLDSLHEAGVPPLAQIRPAVEAAARRARKAAAARDLARTYLRRVEQGEPMDKVAKEMGLPHREFGPFARVEPPITNPMVVGAAFGLEKGRHSGVLDTREGLYVLRVVDRTPADSAAFLKELDQFRAQAVRAARQERVRYYLDALRATAEVEDDRARAAAVGQTRAS